MTERWAPTASTWCSRLQQKRRELMSRFEPLRVIAASATIHNPVQHLETLTGLPFQVVDDRYNGSPRAELTVQHVVGRAPHDEGWRDLQDAVREVISDDPDRSYIAFVDDRQLAERAAAGIEAARSITEDAIIVESRDAMAYRSGLMRRERIEEALRAGEDPGHRQHQRHGAGHRHTRPAGWLQPGAAPFGGTPQAAGRTGGTQQPGAVHCHGAASRLPVPR